MKKIIVFLFLISFGMWGISHATAQWGNDHRSTMVVKKKTTYHYQTPSCEPSFYQNSQLYDHVPMDLYNVAPRYYYSGPSPGGLSIELNTQRFSFRLQQGITNYRHGKEAWKYQW